MECHSGTWEAKPEGHLQYPADMSRSAISSSRKMALNEFN